MTTRALPARRFPAWFVLYLGFVSAVTLIAGVMHVQARGKWTIADWLINYHAGFVRRGLTGEVALRLGSVLHVSPWLLVLLLQLTCYAAMLYAVARLVERTAWPLWKLALVLSPATLAFPVLGPEGGFRKEILLLAGLGLLLVMPLKQVRPLLLAVFTVVLTVVCVLSHESLLVFSIYVIAALLIGLEDRWQGLGLSALVAITAAETFSVVLHHPGGPRVALSVCGALGYDMSGAMPEPCTGAIAYLGHSLAWAGRDVAQQAATYHYARLYTVDAALASIPIVMAFMALWRIQSARRALILVGSAAGLGIVASVPLFLYGSDWGRWIYIHVFSIALLLFFIHQRYGTTEAAPARTPIQRVTLLAYATCWSLPFVGSYGLHFGYVQYVWLLLHNR